MVKCILVEDDSDVMTITDTGRMIRVKTETIRKSSRATQGVKLIRLKGEENIADVCPPSRTRPTPARPNCCPRARARPAARAPRSTRPPRRSRRAATRSPMLSGRQPRPAAELLLRGAQARLAPHQHRQVAAFRRAAP